MKREFSIAFGKALADVIRDTGHTQKEVTDVLCMQSADLTRKLHHGRVFTVDEFVAVCDFLEMDYSTAVSIAKYYGRRKENDNG